MEYLGHEAVWLNYGYVSLNGHLTRSSIRRENIEFLNRSMGIQLASAPFIYQMAVQFN